MEQQIGGPTCRTRHKYIIIIKCRQPHIQAMVLPGSMSPITIRLLIPGGVAKQDDTCSSQGMTSPTIEPLGTSH